MTPLFLLVTEFEGAELALVKKWASSPWETNLVHVPGLAPLKADSALFAQEMVVKFCSELMSPSSMTMEESEMRYMFIAEKFDKLINTIEAKIVEFMAENGKLDICCERRRGLRAFA